jgi:hypothetical protein
MMAAHYYQFMREFAKDMGRYVASFLSSKLQAGIASCYIRYNFYLDYYDTNQIFGGMPVHR